MTVKELLTGCDRSKLLALFIELSEGIYSENEVSDFLVSLEETEPVESDDYIVVGTEYSCDEFSPRIEMTVYDINVLENRFRLILVENNAEIDDEKAEELSEMLYSCGGNGVEFFSRKELLGCSVNEENVLSYGRERFMAEIMCGMALDGIEETRKKVSGISSSMISELKSVSAEERISLDEMVALLFGGDMKNISISEKSFSEESIRNMINKYKTLEMLYKDEITH